MIEPEDVTRYERELDALAAKATHDPEAFAQVVGLVTYLEDRLLGSVTVLRLDGYSFADLARPLGIGKHSVFARWGVREKPSQFDAACRTLERAGLDPGKALRLTVVPPAGRKTGFAVMASQRMNVWVQARRVPTWEEAERFALYLEGYRSKWRYVRTPKDIIKSAPWPEDVTA